MDFGAAATAIGLFVTGAIVVIWATERLLEGLVRLGKLLRLAPFAIAAILSGFEAENIAVGVTAARAGASQIALGTVFGGAIFLVCVALGLGAIIAPLRVQVPRGILFMLALTPLMAGLPLVSATTPRLAALVLLLASIGCLAYLVLASRRHQFFDSKEVSEVLGEQPSWLSAVGLTVLGIAVIAVGGELVTNGATRIVGTFGVSAAIMGMLVTPAAIELEEVIRQAVPAREGRPDVSVGNLSGTLIYFVLFNFGLITLLAPVSVAPLTRSLDWPFLIGATWLALIFVARGRVGRPHGFALLGVYGAYWILHLLLRGSGAG
jgi:cation:H+ antiporter